MSNLLKETGASYKELMSMLSSTITEIFIIWETMHYLSSCDLPKNVKQFIGDEIKNN